MNYKIYSEGLCNACNGMSVYIKQSIVIKISIQNWFSILWWKKVIKTEDGRSVLK